MPHADPAAPDPADADPADADPVDADPVTPDPILTVDDLSVVLSGRPILQQVTFGIGPGQLTGLIGSNGAGKTTLLRVILGLVPPTSGRVTVDGGRGRRTGRIGYVPQKISLEPDMPLRARDLVALGADGHRFGLPRPSAARRDAVAEMLESVGATTFADTRVGRLSGGEQQRVMIAHALISRPKLLLLDEPLANLDIRSAQEVVDLLARIVTEQQIAVFISAHDINPLLPVMDRVVYLAAGRAVAGTSGEVVRTETLSALYGHHVEVIHVQGRVLVVTGRDDDDSHRPGNQPLIGLA